MPRLYQAFWKGAVREPTRVRWRDLSWKEYRKVAGSSQMAGACYMQAYRLCLVDGPVPDEVPAGIASWIGKQQIEESPFSGRYQVLRQYVDRHRAALGKSYLRTARAVLSWAFHYTFEQIDEWPPELFFERLAQAEFLFGRPLEPVDPSAPQPTPEAPPGGKRPRGRPAPRPRAPETDVEHYSFAR